MRQLSLVAVLVASSGCGWWADGGRISAEPSIVCPGSTVTVTWSGAPAGATVRSPSGTTLGSGPSGRATFVAVSSGSASLSSSTGTRTASVQVTSSTPLSIFVPMLCGQPVELGGLWGIAGDAFFTSDVDARFAPSSVVVSRAPAFVFHDGVQSNYLGSPAPISGSLTSNFRVVAPLFDDETCGFPSGWAHNPPTSVLLTVSASCR